MSEITQILGEMRGGNQQGAEQLLSLVYSELKRIAAQKMAGEVPGNTLQPTALVHEAWMKLVWLAHRSLFQFPLRRRVYLLSALRQHQAGVRGDRPRLGSRSDGLAVAERLIQTVDLGKGPLDRL